MKIRAVSRANSDIEQELVKILQKSKPHIVKSAAPTGIIDLIVATTKVPVDDIYKVVRGADSLSSIETVLRSGIKAKGFELKPEVKFLDLGSGEVTLDDLEKALNAYMEDRAKSLKLYPEGFGDKSGTSQPAKNAGPIMAAAYTGHQKNSRAIAKFLMADSLLKTNERFTNPLGEIFGTVTETGNLDDDALIGLCRLILDKYENSVILIKDGGGYEYKTIGGAIGIEKPKLRRFLDDFESGDLGDFSPTELIAKEWLVAIDAFKNNDVFTNPIRPLSNQDDYLKAFLETEASAARLFQKSKIYRSTTVAAPVESGVPAGRLDELGDLKTTDEAAEVAGEGAAKTTDEVTEVAGEGAEGAAKTTDETAEVAGEVPASLDDVVEQSMGRYLSGFGPVEDRPNRVTVRFSSEASGLDPFDESTLESAAYEILSQVVADIPIKYDNNGASVYRGLHRELYGLYRAIKDGAGEPKVLAKILTGGTDAAPDSLKQAFLKLREAELLLVTAGLSDQQRLSLGLTSRSSVMEQLRLLETQMKAVGDLHPSTRSSYFADIRIGPGTASYEDAVAEVAKLTDVLRPTRRIINYNESISGFGRALGKNSDLGPMNGSFRAHNYQGSLDRENWFSSLETLLRYEITESIVSSMHGTRPLNQKIGIAYSDAKKVIDKFDDSKSLRVLDDILNAGPNGVGRVSDILIERLDEYRVAVLKQALYDLGKIELPGGALGFVLDDSGKVIEDLESLFEASLLTKINDSKYPRDLEPVFDREFNYVDKYMNNAFGRSLDGQEKADAKAYFILNHADYISGQYNGKAMDGFGWRPNEPARPDAITYGDMKPGGVYLETYPDIRRALVGEDIPSPVFIMERENGTSNATLSMAMERLTDLIGEMNRAGRGGSGVRQDLYSNGSLARTLAQELALFQGVVADLYKHRRITKRQAIILIDQIDAVDMRLRAIIEQNSEGWSAHASRAITDLHAAHAERYDIEIEINGVRLEDIKHGELDSVGATLNRLEDGGFYNLYKDEDMLAFFQRGSETRGVAPSLDDAVIVPSRQDEVVSDYDLSSGHNLPGGEIRWDDWDGWDIPTLQGDQSPAARIEDLAEIGADDVVDLIDGKAIDDIMYGRSIDDGAEIGNKSSGPLPNLTKYEDPGTHKGAYVVYGDGDTPLRNTKILYTIEGTDEWFEAVASDVLTGNLAIQISNITGNSVSIAVYSRLKDHQDTVVRVFLGTSAGDLPKASNHMQRVTGSAWQKHIDTMSRVSQEFSGPYPNREEAISIAGMRRASRDAGVDDAEVSTKISAAPTAAISMHNVASSRSINLKFLFSEEKGVKQNLLAESGLSEAQIQLLNLLKGVSEQPNPAVSLFKGLDGNYYISYESGKIDILSEASSHLDNLYFRIDDNALMVANKLDPNSEYKPLTDSKAITNIEELLTVDNEMGLRSYGIPVGISTYGDDAAGKPILLDSIGRRALSEAERSALDAVIGIGGENPVYIRRVGPDGKAVSEGGSIGYKIGPGGERSEYYSQFQIQFIVGDGSGAKVINEGELVTAVEDISVLKELSYKILGRPGIGFTPDDPLPPDPSIIFKIDHWTGLPGEDSVRATAIATDGGAVVNDYRVGDVVRMPDWNEDGVIIRSIPREDGVPGSHFVVKKDNSELEVISDPHGLILIDEGGDIASDTTSASIRDPNLYRASEDLRSIAEEYGLTPTIHFKNELFDFNIGMADDPRALVFRPNILRAETLDSAEGIEGLPRLSNRVKKELLESDDSIVAAYVDGYNLFVLRRVIGDANDADSHKGPLYIVNEGIEEAPWNITYADEPAKGGPNTMPEAWYGDEQRALRPDVLVNRRVRIGLESSGTMEDGTAVTKAYYELDIYVPDVVGAPGVGRVEAVASTLRPLVADEPAPFRVFSLKPMDSDLARARSGALVRLRSLDSDAQRDILEQAARQGRLMTEDDMSRAGISKEKIGIYRNRDEALGIETPEGSVVSVDAIVFTTDPVASGPREVAFVWRSVQTNRRGSFDLPSYGIDRRTKAQAMSRNEKVIIEEPAARLEGNVSITNVDGFLDFAETGRPIVGFETEISLNRAFDAASYPRDNQDVWPIRAGDELRVVLNPKKRKRHPDLRSEGREHIDGEVISVNPFDDAGGVVIEFRDHGTGDIFTFRTNDAYPNLKSISRGNKISRDWNVSPGIYVDEYSAAENLFAHAKNMDDNIQELCGILKDIKRQLSANSYVQLDNPFFANLFDAASRRSFKPIEDYVGKIVGESTAADKEAAIDGLRGVISSVDLVEDSGQVRSIALNVGKNKFLQVDIEAGVDGGYRIYNFKSSSDGGRTYSLLSTNVSLNALENLSGFSNSDLTRMVDPSTRQYLGAVIRSGKLKSMQFGPAQASVKVEVEEGGLTYVYHILGVGETQPLDDAQKIILQRSGIEDAPGELAEGDIIRYRTTSVYTSSGTVDAFFITTDGSKAVDTWYQASRAAATGEPTEIANFDPKNTYVITGVAGGENSRHIDTINEFYDNPGAIDSDNPFVISNGRGLQHRSRYDEASRLNPVSKDGSSSEYISSVPRETGPDTSPDYIEYTWPVAPSRRDLDLLSEDAARMCLNCKKGDEVPGIGEVVDVNRNDDGSVVSITFRSELKDERGRVILDNAGDPKYRKFEVSYDELTGASTGYDVLMRLSQEGAGGLQGDAIASLARKIKEVFHQYDQLGIRPGPNSRIQIRIDPDGKKLLPVGYSKASDDVVELQMQFDLPILDSLGRKIDYFDTIMAVAIDALKFRNERLAEAQVKLKSAAALAGMLSGRSVSTGDLGMARQDFNLLRDLPSITGNPAKSGPDGKPMKGSFNPNRIPHEEAPYQSQEHALWKLLYGQPDDPGGAGVITLLQQINYHPRDNNYGFALLETYEYELINKFGKNLLTRYGAPAGMSGAEAAEHAKVVRSMFSAEGMFGKRPLMPQTEGGNPLKFGDQGKVADEDMVSYSDGVLKVGDATFDEFYRNLKELALMVDREVSSDVYTAVKAKASKPLSELVVLTTKKDDRAAKEFLLHNSHLPSPVRSALADSYKAATKKAMNDHRRIMTQNRKYHTDPDAQIPHQRAHEAPFGRGRDRWQGGYTGNKWADRTLDATQFLVNKGTDIGFEYMMGTRGNFAKGLLQVPGAAAENGVDGWLHTRSLAFGFWLDTKPFSWAGDRMPRYVRVLGAFEKGPLSLKGWSNLYESAEFGKRMAMLAFMGVHNTVSHIISINAAIITLPPWLMLKWMEHTSMLAFLKFFKMSGASTPEKVGYGMLGGWGIFCAYSAFRYVASDRTHRSTALRQKFAEYLLEGETGTQGIITRQDFPEGLKKFMVNLPMCAMTDALVMADDEVIKRNLQRQKDAISADMEADGDFDKELRKNVRAFVMAGVPESKGGDCTDDKSCYFPFADATNGVYIDTLVEMSLASTGFSDSHNIHLGLSSVASEDSMWWQNDVIDKEDLSAERINGLLADAVIADRVIVAYQGKLEELSWSGAGEISISDPKNTSYSTNDSLTYQQYVDAVEEYGIDGFEIAGGHDSLIPYGEDISIFHGHTKRIIKELKDPAERADNPTDDKRFYYNYTKCNHIEAEAANNDQRARGCSEEEKEEKFWDQTAEGEFTGMTSYQRAHMDDQLEILSGKLDGQMKRMLKHYRDNRSLLEGLADGHDALYDLLTDMVSPGAISLEERSQDPAFTSGEGEINLLWPLGIPGVDISTSDWFYPGDGYDAGFLGNPSLEALQTTEVDGSDSDAPPAKRPPAVRPEGNKTIVIQKGINRPVPPEKQDE